MPFRRRPHFHSRSTVPQTPIVVLSFVPWTDVHPMTSAAASLVLAAVVAFGVAGADDLVEADIFDWLASGDLFDADSAPFLPPACRRRRSIPLSFNRRIRPTLSPCRSVGRARPPVSSPDTVSLSSVCARRPGAVRVAGIVRGRDADLGRRQRSRRGWRDRRAGLHRAAR